MSTNYYDAENNKLIPIAGNGVGVAKFGTPIENWLTGHSSAATAITADKDGILYYFNYNGNIETPLLATLYVNGKSIRGTRTSGWSSTITLPIRKGDVVYVQDPLSGDQSMFYPFAENIVQPIKGGEEYSTDEKVIGTWIDGKKLYRKVLTLDISTSGGHNINVASLNISQLTLIRGIFNDTQYNYMFPVPDYGDDDTRFYLSYAMTEKNVHYETGARYGINGKLIVTIEYTKTTD